MARVTIEDCLDSVENRFALVMLASKRARQLQKGVGPVVGNNKHNKEPVLALREIASGRVNFDTDVRDLLDDYQQNRPT